MSNPLSNEYFIERFAIKTVDICWSSGLLLIGGMAGQLLICSMDIKRVGIRNTINDLTTDI